MTKTNAKHKVVWNEKVVTAIYSNQNYKRKKNNINDCNANENEQTNEKTK